MAESQVPYSYAESGQDIKAALSKERFTPYVVKAGYDLEYAFNLYLYNARLSKAFLFPLHILEVCLRNRINDIFCSDFSNDWPHNSSFTDHLSLESLGALEKGIERAKSPKTEDVVATLTFDFWSNLFRPEYDRPLWQSRMADLLPNIHKTRKEFQQIVRKLNMFRNRIAHHEPIHTLDITSFHKAILDVLSWLSVDTSQWVKHHSTVNRAVRTKPAATGGFRPYFCERADSNFSEISNTTRLSELPQSRFILCQDQTENLVAVVEMHHIGQYILSLTEGAELVVDLEEHDLDQVIQHENLKQNFDFCGGSESFGKSELILKGKVKYIVVENADATLGVIAKAHRRY